MKAFVTSNATECIVQLTGHIKAGVGTVLMKTVLPHIDLPKVLFNCEQVQQIDSTGAGEWIRFITIVAERAAVQYRNVPVALVDSFNLVPAMLGVDDVATKMSVRSFRAPYQCKGCKVYSSPLIMIEEVLPQRHLPVRRCADCGQNAVSEILSEDYLVFLER